jgi:hypothetical protein
MRIWPPFTGYDNYLGTCNFLITALWFIRQSAKFLKKKLNNGTGAAAAAFLSGVVQNQRINNLENCMENIS